MINRRHRVQAYARYQACPKWERIESRIGCIFYPKYPRKIPAESEVLNSASNKNQERDNLFKALKNYLEQTVSRKPCCGKDCLRSQCFRESRKIC